MIPFAPGFFGGPKGDANVVLLARFNEAAGATQVIDSSVYNHPFPNVSSTIYQTASSPQVFSGSNVGQFPGASGGTYVYTDSNNVLSLGTGDFTIEGFFHPTSSVNGGVIEGRLPGVLDNETWAILMLGGTNTLELLELSAVGVVQTMVFGNATLSAWWYFAASRTSGQISGYLGAVAGGTASRVFLQSSTFPYNCGSPAFRGVFLGANTSTEKFIGYLEAIRITKGVGRYSDTSISIPTTEY